MNKLILAVASIVLCAAAFTGYRAYQNSHLTPEQALLKANVEALALREYDPEEEGKPIPNIPCIRKMTKTCKFLVKLADGTLDSMTVQDAEYYGD